MKHLIPAIHVILCVAASGFAEDWQPFVAVSGVMDIPSQEVSYECFQLRFQTSTYMYPGTEFEGGIRADKHEWYVAYHLAHSPQLFNYYSNGSSYVDSANIRYEQRVQSFRSEQRMLAGHRFWPMGTVARLSPFFGVGAELGFSNGRANAQNYRVVSLPDSTGTWYHYSHRELIRQYQSSDHDNAYGGLAEFGLALSTWGSLETLMITQLHVYAIKHRFWSFSYWDWYLMPSGVLQLRYVIH